MSGLHYTNELFIQTSSYQGCCVLLIADDISLVLSISDVRYRSHSNSDGPHCTKIQSFSVRNKESLPFISHAISLVDSIRKISHGNPLVIAYYLTYMVSPEKVLF